MPKLEATSDVLFQIADDVYMGRIRTLHIRRYKSGVNKGKLFAEYTLKDDVVPFDNTTLKKRALICNVIKKGAYALRDGKEIDIKVKKLYPDKDDKYIYSLIIKEV